MDEKARHSKGLNSELEGEKMAKMPFCDLWLQTSPTQRRESFTGQTTEKSQARNV